MGINSWVAHRNRSVFGSDANLFRPERWLEEKESFSERDAYFLSVSFNNLSREKGEPSLTLLQFGQGSRTCIGKNISLLEVSKAIPQVVRHMDIELENQKEWTVANHWFTKPQDFTCRVKRRAA